MLDNVYNTAGDLARDKNKGLALIEYDFFGNPTRIQFRNGNVTEYVYSAAGQKLREKHTTAIDGLTVSYGQTLQLTPAQIMAVDTTDYSGPWMFQRRGNPNVTYLDAMSYHFDGGYMTFYPVLVPVPFLPSVMMTEYVPSYHYYIRDHQGNNRVVVSHDGTVEQTNDYYAYGGPWGNTSTNQGFQPFKYNGKELDRVHGLDWYDYGARRYDPAFAQFTQMDPLCEQYPYLSPYAYCAGNPVNAIDPDGDSICVLNMGEFLDQHMALLIQNDDNKWAYYSFNGDKVYNKTLGLLGGGPINNMGNREFDSPQVFLDSDYNTEESNPKKQIINDEINGYGYKEGFVIPTTKEQDAIIRSTYQKNVKKGYNLFFNQCSQAVQKSLNAAGLRTTQSMWISTDPQSMHLFQIEVNPYFPSRAFNSIINNNPKGILYKKRK